MQLLEQVVQQRLLVNGRRIYSEIYGIPANPWVVLLHHGLGSTYAWKEQISALLQAGYCVMTYDRRGYGQSEARDQLISPVFTDDIRDLEQLLDHMCPSHLSLVGHSDGGTIALHYAVRHPERVLCLVVVAAHIYVEQKMDSGIADVERAFLHDQRFRMGLARVHGANFPAMFWNWYQGWRREVNLGWDMRPELAGIRCPTLVVQGVEDEHATPRHAEDLSAAISGSELWLVDGADHMLPQAQPAAFNQRLVAFLQKTVSGVNYVQ